MTTNFITIGHGAYSGVNKLRVCVGKAQALRVLINRGLPSKVAKAKLEEVLAKNRGYATAACRGEVVEIRNSNADVAEGVMRMDKETRVYLKTIPET